MTIIKELNRLGQSIGPDNLRRPLIDSGELQHLIDDGFHNDYRHVVRFHLGREISDHLAQSLQAGRISLDMLKRDFAVVFSIVASITLAEVIL